MSVRDCISVTISGPQGSGKTQLLKAVRRAFIRYRREGRIQATTIRFREVQTKVKK